MERAGDWRLKVYGLATPGRAARAALVDAVVRRAARVLPEPAITEERYGVGFLIAHDAATACFGLVYWWQAANELHQRCFMSPVDDPGALAKLPDPAAGCVWELAIIGFERRAWIDDVLANPDGADIERYLGRQLTADV